MPVSIPVEVAKLHADLDKLNLTENLRKNLHKYRADENLVKFLRAVARNKKEFVSEAGNKAYTQMFKKAIGMMSYEQIDKDIVYGKTLIMNILEVSKDIDDLLEVLGAMSRKGLALVNKKPTHSAYYFLRSMMVSMTTPRTEADKTALLPMMKPVIELTYNIDQLEEVKGGFEWHKETLNKKGDTSRDVAFGYMVKLLSERMQYLKSPSGILQKGMFYSNFMGYAKKKIGKVQADDLRGMKVSSQKESVKPVGANTLASNRACATTVRNNSKNPLHQSTRSMFVG